VDAQLQPHGLRGRKIRSVCPTLKTPASQNTSQNRASFREATMGIMRVMTRSHTPRGSAGTPADLVGAHEGRHQRHGAGFVQLADDLQHLDLVDQIQP